jgi:hypothetical protein
MNLPVIAHETSKSDLSIDKQHCRTLFRHHNLVIRALSLRDMEVRHHCRALYKKTLILLHLYERTVKSSSTKLASFFPL